MVRSGGAPAAGFTQKLLCLNRVYALDPDAVLRFDVLRLSSSSDQIRIKLITNEEGWVLMDRPLLRVSHCAQCPLIDVM